ncbi:MAG: hypothetical protein K2O48_03785, partial [Prevotella sp.]|nr:hypothetical protein [Prevotella sp.]
MKIIKRISNIVVWTLLGLYLMFFLVANMTWVQEYLGQWTAKTLSQKLGTSVSIESADVGLLNHLTLNNVRIKDQQGKDMLQCGRLSVRLELLPLTEGKIVIA